MIRYITISVCCLLLAACASTSHDVRPVTVSMQSYVKLTCEELRTELGQVNEQISTVSRRIDETSVGSRLAMGIGVVFWPALFLIDGKGDAQDKLAQLKGQKISIEDAMLEHDCEHGGQQLRTARDALPARVALPTNLPPDEPAI